MIQLCLRVLIFVASVDGTYVKGVSKTMQNEFLPVAGKFRCLDGSKTIPYSFLNDDYCDCSDGSDEPGTTACPFSTFYCRNLGHRETKIFSMDVNDKICNCCDGSDEPASFCPDTCAEIAAEEREKTLKIIRMLSDAKSKISTANSEFESRAKDFQSGIPELDRKLAENREKLAQLEENRVFDNDSLHNAKKAYVDIWEKDLRSKYSEQIFQVIDKNYDKIIEAGEFNASSLAKIFDVSFLGALNFPFSMHDFVSIWIEKFPPIIDDGVLESPNLPVEDEEIEYGEDGLPVNRNSHAETESAHEESPDEVHGYVLDFKRIYDEFVSKKNAPINEEIIQIEERLKERDSSIENTRKDLMSMSRHLKFLQSFDGIDFGPNRAYSLLFDLCLPFEQPPFTYSICPFYKGSQTRNEKSFDIGYWAAWADQEEKYMKMVYTDGDVCYDDIRRSFEINLSCGSENTIKSISERQVCKYVVELETPAACVHIEMPRVHDEL